MYESLRSLDSLVINFSSEGVSVLNVILAFIMFGVALEIKISDFRTIFYKPTPLLVGLTSQLIVLPALTFALVALCRQLIPPSVAMGMILVAACPGGNMSNFMSSLAKGNTALSVSITTVNSTIAFITTPFNFAFWGTRYVNFINRHSDGLVQTLELSVSHMLYTLCILLIIPLIVGMACSHFLPRLSKKMLQPLKGFSIVAFVAMLFIALAHNFNNFIHHLDFIFVVVLVHNALAILSGLAVSRIFCLNSADSRAVTIETGIQNSGLGLGLLFNPKIFPVGVVTGGMLFVVAWWGIWHVVSGFFVVMICRRRSALAAKPVVLDLK